MWPCKSCGRRPRLFDRSALSGRTLRRRQTGKTNGVIQLAKKIKWILLLGVLVMILALNLQSQRGTLALSNHVAGLLSALTTADSNWIYTHIRKLGHIFEFFWLGLANYLCFGWRGLLFDGGISLLDQCAKIVLPTRHFDITDLPYDMAGYVLGSCTGWAGRKLIRKLKKVSVRV